ncbi:redoxin domain-containing protein [Caulobacter sp. KR2-114]|uniref:redoxin domain-containing protein n=1 Tax=Caulobacter sp. KR2-114 TaxID=3400912 RepID=UPI003C0D4519
MTLLIASQALSWTVIAVLAAVCLALARQVGVLHERIAPAGALSIKAGVTVGEPAPEFSVQTLTGALATVGGQRAGRSQLLFFLSPDCPVCKTLLPAIKSLSHSEATWLDLILLSDGPGDAHGKFVRAQGLDAYPYAVSELVGQTFGVSKLPYAVLIGEDGRVAANGLVNTREHLDSLLEAKERKVASIQDFLAQRHAQQA